jgi:antagonist of KipI
MSLLVHRPGLLTTVQDLGRWGHQDRGVGVAGPMDAVSHRLANLLVGNEGSAATLEITLIGPEVEFERPAFFAVTGARFVMTLDGESVPPDTVCAARPGSRLRFGARTRGARAYLAVTGGIDVAPILGSRATHLPSRMGGLSGRAIRTGDRLPVGGQIAVARQPGFRRAGAVGVEGGATVRCIAGPQDRYFGERGLQILESARYRVGTQSNRMGYRLEGPVLERADRTEVLSDATPIGTLQVPPSGQPILLMADRQTTGGYPKIATVITADLPIAGQLGPGDWIAFAMCDRASARAALAEQERWLEIEP